ncbi:hypothetical protein [Spirosoma montaniterrae]|uniref:Uncharacterized protein n=1 Tax=Spirosoma montaniterrae TaxID=1178516 RepID=A0A1P9WRB4_9BACT|nr:hypothetical protein [Spirosoma montaniterrae]AQG77912.1 hypothetical protein AWR27_00210 [Spirosoma montaniterrae]
MKTNEQPIGLMLGNGNETTKDICRSLAKNGVSAIVIQKEGSAITDVEPPRQWSGQPGKDLFFNGWKLLF